MDALADAPVAALLLGNGDDDGDTVPLGLLEAFAASETVEDALLVMDAPREKDALALLVAELLTLLLTAVALDVAD